MHTEHGPGLWTTPQCPFAIEYAPRALDDIRLAVMDAFFSLPRGGAEIGGVLLGKYGAGRLHITDYRALECEHAFGPGFTLSDRDKNLLTHLLAASHSGGFEPVGWYHSHTRSEIFLSEADLAIHDTYFPERWQVALVIKPHTFHPARAGFFFREPDGSIHASATYLEFQLQPLGVLQVPTGVLPAPVVHPPPVAVPPPVAPPSEPLITRPSMMITVAAQPIAAEPVLVTPDLFGPREPEIEVEPKELELEVVEPESIETKAIESETAQPEVVEPEAIERDVIEPKAIEPEAIEPQPEAVGEPADDTREERSPHTDIPRFLRSEPARSWKWLKVAAAIAVGVGLGSLAYATRESWVPRVLAGFERLKGTPASAAAAPVLPPAPAAIGLSVIDTDGQLQVHWDRLSSPVRTGSHAVLEVVDSGAAPQALTLDEAHLESGIFTYARQGERVDVALAIDQPNGKRVRESTTFLGRLPDKPEDASVFKRQRDDLARQNTQLQADIRTAAERARKAEKALADLQTEIKQQQRRRLQNQSSK